MEEDKNRISIVIPVYNEESAISPVLSEVLEYYPDSEIIVVDDGSTDNTAVVLRKFNVKVITHEKNKGYGSALKTGIKNSTKDIVVTIDADGEYPPKDIASLIAGLDIFDMAVGKRENISKNILWKTSGRYIFQATVNLITGLRIPDINSGLRAFKRKTILRYIDFLSETFSFSTSATLAFILNKHRIKYTSIQLRKRIGASKVNLLSGVKSLFTLYKIAFLFKPVRLFLLFAYPLATISLLASSAYSLFIQRNTYLTFICASFIFFLLFTDILTRCKKDTISFS